MMNLAEKTVTGELIFVLYLLVQKRCVKHVLMIFTYQDRAASGVYYFNMAVFRINTNG